MPALPEEWTPEQLMKFCPAGCRVSVDRHDSAFRATYKKNRFSKAWRKYGVQGAAFEIIKLVWGVSILLGFEWDVPTWVHDLPTTIEDGNDGD